MSDADTDVGRRCERISLDMIDGKDIVSKGILTFQIFICRITSAVYGMKLLTQFFGMFDLQLKMVEITSFVQISQAAEQIL